MYHDEVAKILLKLLKKNGVINIGGKRQTIYNFARNDNKKIEKIFLDKTKKNIIPHDSSMNLKKLKHILNKNKILSK